MRGTLTSFALTAMVVVGMAVSTGCAPHNRIDQGDGLETRHRERLVQAGESTFESLCASCHGMNARGNGPVAATLVTSPSDLTMLSARYAGRFPTAELRDIVNVHRVIPAHGTEELPVWGNIWNEDGAWPRRRDIIEYEIDALIEYIRTIQRDGSP